MDPQKIMNIIITVMLAVMGWLGNNVWNAVQSQQQQITQVNIELAKNYMPRVELQQSLDRIYNKLDQIDTQTKSAARKE